MKSVDLKKRLNRSRPMTSVTIRIPMDVIEDLQRLTDGLLLAIQGQCHLFWNQYCIRIQDGLLIAKDHMEGKDTRVLIIFEGSLLCLLFLFVLKFYSKIMIIYFIKSTLKGKK